MTNSTIIDEITPTEQNVSVSETYDVMNPRYNYPAYVNERAGKIVDEIMALVKDDRINTKHAISADIASTTRVQNQNERVISAYERELRRHGLSDEQRDELLSRMSDIAKSTAYANKESREFQRQQLDYSHKLPRKIAIFIAIIAVCGICGTALLRSAT